MATTSILGDVVRAVGGDALALDVLVPSDTDPHSFEPAPRDAALIARADLIFINGLGLEEFGPFLISNAADPSAIISVSDGIETIEFEGEEFGADPHVWTNPLNVIVWVDNIAAALVQADPANAEIYRSNAEDYKSELEDLDQWVKEQIALIPETARLLVTDHEAFGYFAQRYSFQIVGALVPSYSSSAEPSAGELAALETVIQQYGVHAIFVSASVNPTLAERVAADTGVQLLPLYTEALSGADGPAPTYLDLIRYDVETIVGALK